MRRRRASRFCTSSDTATIGTTGKPQSAPRGVHIFRHSAAKLRREAGESIEEVSRFLDHSSLAVTTVYLRQLEGDRDTTWQQVAATLGILDP